MDALIRAARVAPKRTRLSEALGSSASDERAGAAAQTSQSPTRPLRDILREEIEREVRAELAEGARQIYEAERARGMEEGREAGLAAARASAAESAATTRAELKEAAATALASLERAHRSSMARFELAVGEVAFAAVCRLAGERAVTREFVEGLVEQVCAELKSQSSATARLHPRDIETLRELFDGHELRVASLMLKIVPDESLDLGGTFVETESGSFDGTLETQLRRLHDVLMRGPSGAEERR